MDAVTITTAGLAYLAACIAVAVVAVRAVSWGLPFTRRTDPAAAERDRLARDLAVARRALADAETERDELRATVLRQATTIAALRTELSARRVGSLAARARAAHDATTAPHRTKE